MANLMDGLVARVHTPAGSVLLRFPDGTDLQALMEHCAARAPGSAKA